jgi:transposase-like protein
MVALRWEDGVVTCPYCPSRECRFLTSRSIWYCKSCKKQFSIKVGTFMEDSPITLNYVVIVPELILVIIYLTKHIRLASN